MDFLIASLYGIIQGITEFFPISSSAHLAILPKFMNFNDPGVEFDLFMHLGTALSVIIYYRKKIMNLVCSSLNLVKHKFRAQNEDEAFSANFILTTLVSVIFILLVKKYADQVGRGPFSISFNLAIFGWLFMMADKWRKNSVFDELQIDGKIFWKIFVFIGIAQALAIFPGVSRSGITLTAALFLGVNRKKALDFSFLLSLPVIIGGSIILLPKYFSSNNSIEFIPTAIAFSLSFFFGMLAIHCFKRIFDKFGALPFFVYRVLLAITILLSL